MAEEVQATQESQGATQAKNKKITKFSLDELNKKIDELEKSQNLRSRYYKHLLNRRKELQGS